MAAQSEPSNGIWTTPQREPHAAAQPSALVLPMRPKTAKGRAVIVEASGDRVGAARGIVLGLVLGLALWAGIVWLARAFFH